jgi:lipopolysaccharide transport system permease protein
LAAKLRALRDSSQPAVPQGGPDAAAGLCVAPIHTSTPTRGKAVTPKVSDIEQRSRRGAWIDPRMIDLVLYKTYADLRAEAAKTYINYLWWIVDPILSMLVFYVVFGVLLGRGGDGFVAFLLTGLVFWSWYNQTLSHAGNTILSAGGLMNQVHVPKLVFPVVTILTDFTKFCVVLAVLLLFLWLSGYAVSAAYLALPFVIAIQLMLCTALSLLLAGIVPYLPDLKLVVNNLIHLQFFLSGIFFAPSEIPEQYHTWFYANPMATLIESYRDILLNGTWPNAVRLTVIAVVCCVVLAAAIALIKRFDTHYPRLAR